MLAARGVGHIGLPAARTRAGPTYTLRRVIDVKSLTALVVDDDPDFCRWVERTLGSEGFDVETTGDPAEAAQRVYSAEPSIVVVDIALGDHDGFAVARRLRNITPGVPLILVSSLDLTRATHVYMGLPRPVTITKPIERAALVGAVGKAMKAVT